MSPSGAIIMYINGVEFEIQRDVNSSPEIKMSGQRLLFV